jgi:predicted RNA-binding Zn-ribbon protein involved in translation (DUF1610 family)
VSPLLECRECDWQGPENEVATDHDYMCGVKVRFQICPDCGSEQIDEIQDEVIV